MTNLEWNDIYSIDNDEIDKQHKILFSIFNMLVVCVGNAQFNNSVIDELISYTHYHFYTEEQYMIIVSYIDVDRHIEEHKYFVRRIEELRQSNVNTEQYLGLISFLSDWLLNHIMIEDKKITHITQ